MTIIDIKEWKEKYPKKCAIIQHIPGSETTAYLIEQSARSHQAAFEEHFRVRYGHDKSYSFI